MIGKWLLLLLLFSFLENYEVIFSLLLFRGVFVYKDFTSSNTSHELSGTVSTALSLLIKLHVSLKCDGICLTIG